MSRRARVVLGPHPDGVGMVLPTAPFEKVLGEKAKSWAGRCYEIACAVVDKGMTEGGVAVYGHWLGPVHERSMFYRSGAIPFQRHGWVLLAGGSVLDPTRWVFEANPPYIYVGPVGDYYDEGGNKWRGALQGDPPEYDPLDRHVDVPTQILPTAAWNFVERYLRLEYGSVGEDEGQRPGVLTQRQVVYLANAPLAELGEHADAVYRALEKLDEVCLIPLDNYQRIVRARGYTGPTRSTRP